MIQTVTALNVN